MCIFSTTIVNYKLQHCDVKKCNANLVFFDTISIIWLTSALPLKSDPVESFSTHAECPKITLIRTKRARQEIQLKNDILKGSVKKDGMVKKMWMEKNE